MYLDVDEDISQCIVKMLWCCLHIKPMIDRGERWHTTLRLTISPFAFLTLRSFIKKYQNLDLATTVFGANIRMRYSFGVGFVSVGR